MFGHGIKLVQAWPRLRINFCFKQILKEKEYDTDQKNIIFMNNLSMYGKIAELIMKIQSVALVCANITNHGKNTELRCKYSKQFGYKL